MAVTKENKATSLRCKYETGSTASGAATYSTRSLNLINPDAQDENVYTLGKNIGTDLVAYELVGVVREDSANLIESA